MTSAADAPAEGRVLSRRDGSVVHVTLSNPTRRNAFTWRMYDELERLCGEVADDRDVRLVVVRGDGGAAFAAGTDIRQFVGFTADDGVEYEHRVARVLDGLAAVPVPVLAVVDGPAVGAGLAVVSCCDVVVAADDAVFGAPIARTLGNCLPPPVVARLRARLGAGRTMAMLLTSRLVDAREAQVAGLVHEVAARDELDAAVDRVVRRVTSGAPLTLAALKEVDRRLHAAAAEVDANDVLRRCYGSADFREGVAAFLEHRRPQWEGR